MNCCLFWCGLGFLSRFTHEELSSVTISSSVSLTISIFALEKALALSDIILERGAHFKYAK